LLARARGMAGFERHVVIKRIHDDRAGDPTFVQAFMTEARLAAALHHHNIVQVQDIGEDGGAPYFAMEYVHGEDVRTILAHLIKRRERLPLEHVVAIVAAAAAALHHAHESSTPDGKPLAIVHRDVTPANILVSYDGNVKVVDFGIAKAAITMTTQVGVLKGRCPYMAPEQCAAKPVDRRSDVFALGIVLWEMATMRRLFKGKTDHETMRAIVTGFVPKPSSMRPDLPPALETIIMKALEKAPERRYATAAELGNALEAFAKSAGLSTATSALATYLAQHVGPRQEPWLVEGEELRSNIVDFDKEEDLDMQVTKPKLPPPKLAATPAIIDKLVPAPPVLPVAVAAVPVSEQPTVTASIVVTEDVGAPVETTESTDRADTASEASEASDKTNETKIEPRAQTSQSTPPPPPIPLAARKSDLTAIVKPLPIETTEPIPPSRRKTLVLAGIGAGVVALVVVVFVIATSGDSKLASVPTPAAKPEKIAPPPPPPVPPPSPPVEVPAPPPVEVAAPAPPPPVEVAPPPPVEATPPPPVEVAPPPPVEVAPSHPVVKKPAVKKPIVKKPVAKPKYDPNSLFLKSK